MPGTMPSIHRDALTRLQAGDEQTLRRIFDDHYSTLTSEAATLLEDPRGAPRVVENVFVRVWDERTEFESPEALEAFLHKATREGAARALSRKASLHRFESHEGVHAHGNSHRKEPSTAGEAWTHVEHTIHARSHRDETLHEMADHSRHVAAEHVGGMTKRKPWLWPAVGLAAVAVVILTPIALIDRASEDRAVTAGSRPREARHAVPVVILTPIALIDRASEDRAVTAGIRSREARTLVARQGSRTALRLGDGTDVTLGGDSKLTVPPGFGDRLRGVGLEGTGTFVVAPEQPLVFQVRAKEVAIKALGTTFTVRAYPDENFVAVRVKEGQVTVQGQQDPRTLTAGQAVMVDAEGAMREPTQQEIDEALAWSDGRLVMNQKP